jgi:hypothetical protein
MTGALPVSCRPRSSSPPIHPLLPFAQSTRRAPQRFWFGRPGWFVSSPGVPLPRQGHHEITSLPCAGGPATVLLCKVRGRLYRRSPVVDGIPVETPLGHNCLPIRAIPLQGRTMLGPRGPTADGGEGKEKGSPTASAAAAAAKGISVP